MAALNYSRQRESIMEFLRSRKDHPTADTVYENIRAIYPRVSLGTIYRNLALLESIGEIIKITTGDGADRYDATVEQHHHFVCTECHSVIDLEMENIDYIKDKASENFGGSIESYVTNFYGICPECKAKKEIEC